MRDIKLTLYPGESLNICQHKYRGGACNSPAQLYERSGMHKLVVCNRIDCTSRADKDASQRRCEAIDYWNEKNPVQKKRLNHDH